MPFFLRMGHISRRWGLIQLVCMLIILVWAVASIALGGDTCVREGGRYFLGDHGHLKEVSRNAYYAMRILGWSAFAALLGFLGLSILSKRENDREEVPFP